MKEEIYKYMEETLGLTGADADEVFSLFIVTLKEQAAQVKPAIAAKDFMKIRAITHTLFGCSKTIGANEIVKALEQLNAAAKALDIAACETASVEFFKQYELMIALAK